MPISAITRLENSEDWLRFRERHHRFEVLSPAGPYLTWAYQHEAWRAASPGSPCWLMELEEDGTGEEGFLAAAIFLDSTVEVAGGQVRMLESLDHNVIHRPPFLMRKGRGKDAISAMIDASSHLARTTGAHTLRLGSMDALSKDLLHRELRHRGVDCGLVKQGTCHQIRLPDDLGEFWESKNHGFARRLRRSQRLLPRETGKTLGFSRMRGDIAGTTEFRDYFAQLKGLLEKGGEPGGAAFYEGLVEDWSRRGWLDIALLDLEQEPIAGQLSVVVEKTQWVMLTAYEPAYVDYGPGRILFLRQLEDAHSRGDRLIELGDGNVDWKKLWSNRVEHTFELTWPLERTP